MFAFYAVAISKLSFSKYVVICFHPGACPKARSLVPFIHLKYHVPLQIPYQNPQQWLAGSTAHLINNFLVCVATNTDQRPLTSKHDAHVEGLKNHSSSEAAETLEETYTPSLKKQNVTKKKKKKMFAAWFWKANRVSFGLTYHFQSY